MNERRDPLARSDQGRKPSPRSADEAARTRSRATASQDLPERGAARAADVSGTTRLASSIRARDAAFVAYAWGPGGF